MEKIQELLNEIEKLDLENKIEAINELKKRTKTNKSIYK